MLKKDGRAIVCKLSKCGGGRIRLNGFETALL